MTSNLTGDKRRRKQLELSQEWWRCYQLSGERDGILAAIEKAQNARPFTLTEKLQVGALRERLGHVSAALTTARVRAENCGAELGEDPGVESFFDKPAAKPRGGAVRIDVPPTTVARSSSVRLGATKSAVAQSKLDTVRRTVEAGGYLTRMISPSR